jgi:hypothetical protein
MMRRFRALVSAGLLLCAASLCPAESITPEAYRRAPEQTFLTFPEWYLVHSPAEYAAYLQDAPHPSRFPLFHHIAQFWQGYAAVTGETRDHPFNGGYHLMVSVIGTSTTVEYGLKGLYERTVGRLAEATRSGDHLTPEEKLAARAAQDYVDFIRVDPWYLFDFKTRLVQLWQLPLGGPDTIRRMERRFLLTSEYLVKEGYARLIKLATRSIYDAPKPVTAIVLDKAGQADAAHPEFKVVADAGAGQLATIPRYEAFTTYSRWLAAQGFNFREIAGNRGDIVVSLRVPLDFKPATGTRLLFSQPILTRANEQRVVLAMPVAALADQVRRETGTVRLEHIYDF